MVFISICNLQNFANNISSIYAQNGSGNYNNYEVRAYVFSRDRSDVIYLTVHGIGDWLARFTRCLQLYSRLTINH